MTFTPYLFFGGDCAAAFTRYQEIFGGELTLLRMGDVPGGTDGHASPEQADLIIHAALVADGALLMASDDPSGDYEPAKGMSVAVSPPDVAEANRIFDALAEGGQVTQPLLQTFFSPAFGMCVDRFGIPWMVSAAEGAS
jgi:PhnB protein